ncbi:MAG: tetratricopeptide repeat protein [Desulfobulbaceae bacterium]|nr:tetratricopeptide repeat protein [Desulfobulbaceae bacterium]
MKNLLISSIVFISLLAGCASHTQLPKKQIDNDQEDLSCAYFYFLWGAHAEFDEHYSEALEAYEKALICDPKAGYVKEKLPILMLKMGEFDQAAAWLSAAIVEHPKNDTYKLFLANLYVQQDKIPKAITLYRNVLENDPDNEAVIVRLGLLYSREEQYDVAEGLFRKLLQKNELSYFTRLSLARLLKLRKNYDEAITEYEKALSLNWSKELAYELGFLYVNRNQLDDALRIYTTITENDQFDERGSLSRIQALLDLKRYEEAMNALNRLKHFSNNPERIDLIISKVLLQQKQTEKAKGILLQLVNTSEATEPKYMLALLAFQDEDYETSLHYLGKIGAASEEFEEAVYLQTRIFREQEELQKAIHLLKTCTSEEKSSSPLFFALLSSLYQDQGKIQEAVTTMETAVTTYPENHQLLFEYGLLLEKKGEHQNALSKMEMVLSLQSNHPEALNFIGYTWADNNIHLEKALLYIQKASELKPDNGFIMDSLGWVYFRQGKYEEAAKTLEKSLLLEPEDPHIYEHLGDVYTALENYEKALTIYKQAYELFEDEEKKKSVKGKIDALEQ